jgi:tRNA-uridine 2-sulfurtransferase
LHKDVTRNALVVGSRAELGQTELLVRDVNWVADAPPASTLRGGVKVRYKATAAPAAVAPLPEGGARVLFDDFVFGATPGQAAVFYDGDVPWSVAGSLPTW